MIESDRQESARVQRRGRPRTVFGGIRFQLNALGHLFLDLTPGGIPLLLRLASAF